MQFHPPLIFSGSSDKVGSCVMTKRKLEIQGIFPGKSEGKTLGRCSHKRELIDTKTDFKEIGCEDVDWI
jgi:hypothetical protein